MLVTCIETAYALLEVSITLDLSDGLEEEDKATFRLPGARERKPSAIIYTKKRTIYTAGELYVYR